MSTKNHSNSPAHLRPYLTLLEDSIKQELKFRGCAQPNCSSGSSSGEMSITSGMRDGSAHVLRCLKVWYDLPSEVFFNAVSSIDRFLSKMKAQPKHLSCIAVSAFHLACRQHHQLVKGQQKYQQSCPVPDPSDLVTISQSRCSPSDLLRMETILANKLELNLNEVSPACAPVTSLTLLRIMFNVAKAASLRLDMPDLLPESLPDHLVHQLEIISCDSATLQFRPSEVALAVLASEFQRLVSDHNNVLQPRANALMGFISELQKHCNIAGNNFVQCLGIVVNQLERYNGEGTVTHRQRLVWKLSNRTLRHLRPTDKLRATLPTINEITNAQRLRSNSECSEESMESSLSESEFEREIIMDEESTNPFFSQQ